MEFYGLPKTKKIKKGRWATHVFEPKPILVLFLLYIYYIQNRGWVSCCPFLIIMVFLNVNSNPKKAIY